MIFRDLQHRYNKIFGEEEALVFENKRYTYNQMSERINRLSNALIKLGVKKGDRIAVLQQNCNQYVELYYGIANASAVIVPLNYRLNPSELITIIEDSEANLLFFSVDYLDAVEKIKQTLKTIRHYVSTDEKSEAYLYYEDILDDANADQPNIKIEEDDNFGILYTSGTLSLPKGVVLSHKNMVVNTLNQCLAVNLQPGSINLHVSPLYHATNSHIFCHVFVHGKNILIKHFDPVEVLETIERERVTYMMIVPTMLYAILDVPELDKYDLSSLNTIAYGAASITDTRLEEAANKFGYNMIQAYGLTETTSFSSVLMKEEHKYVKNSIGRGMIGVETKVVDDSDNEVKPGEIGEIVIRGDTVMKEYWKRPELTSETIVDGWLHSGDMARIDQKGYMYVVDRKKDLIISGAINIFPGDIEMVIAKHPAVAEVAVFGVPDAKWGESIKAAITVRPGKEVTAEEIINFTGEHLARYKRPKSVEIMEELPKTASGKILKRELRAAFGKQ